MKKRLAALLFFLIAASPAFAQLQQAPAPGPQSAPIAAPSGAGSTSASRARLAAPNAAPSGRFPPAALPPSPAAI